MVEAIEGVATSFIYRTDKKQYRSSLSPEVLKVTRLSKREIDNVRGQSSHSWGHVDRVSTEEIVSIFNRKFYGVGEAIGRIRGGEAFSLPISKDFCIMQKSGRIGLILNKGGHCIARIDNKDRVVLPKSLIQIREQIEGLGMVVVTSGSKP
jgi:hypothetical protein